MLRALYSLLLYLFTPLVLLRLLHRSRRQPEYREHWAERWGFYGASSQASDTAPRPLIWVHAVSVGETRAAEPLIRRLQARFPDHDLLLTAMTPTGRATARTVYGDSVRQAYLPYDYPDAVGRFLRHFRPRFGILMETEIWPNLLAGCRQAGVPVSLANARLSARSAKGYRRFAALARPAFAALHGVAAQTADDATRLAALGARQVQVCGNLKFDVRPDPAKLALGQDWRAAIGPRPVWLYASTREGEDAALLAAWQEAGLAASAQALLIWVPRHPQRFDEIAQAIAAAGWRLGRRNQGLPGPDTQVWLGDSMGEMPAYYAAADGAYIGGSLVPLGGQNLIEAAACGCPSLIGPHTFNFTQASDDALAAGAALRVGDAGELASTLRQLLTDPARRTAMVAAASQFARQHQGATERMLDVVIPSGISPLPPG